MIRLSKTQIEEIAQVMVIANTPLSLLRGYERSSAIASLIKQNPEELVGYYDRITARASRTEVAVAIAYAMLIAILIKARDKEQPPVDASRLLWGERIQKRLAMETRTQVFNLDQGPSLWPDSSILR